MQRQLLSAAARAARAPAVRSTVQRRFASTTENAFIKEREAAKHHAAETTGSSSPALYESDILQCFEFWRANWAQLILERRREDRDGYNMGEKNMRC